MPSTSINPPTFEVPSDNNSNYEIWCLRAPAHLDVSEILNGVTLDVNTKLLDSAGANDDADTSHNTTNTTLTKFKTKQDGQDYELTLGDASEVNHLRLLVPDKDDEDTTTTKKLKAHNKAFQRYITLTCVTTNAQEELVLAPARENAPRPAFGEVGINGSVPAMRLAYVPVPQKEGLKRRWAMPGSRTTTTTTTKRLKVSPATDDDVDNVNKEVEENTTTKSAKKMKKKEKKEKKSKKSPKK